MIYDSILGRLHLGVCLYTVFSNDLVLLLEYRGSGYVAECFLGLLSQFAQVFDHFALDVPAGIAILLRHEQPHVTDVMCGWAAKLVLLFVVYIERHRSSIGIPLRSLHLCQHVPFRTHADPLDHPLLRRGFLSNKIDFLSLQRFLTVVWLAANGLISLLIQLRARSAGQLDIRLTYVGLVAGPVAFSSRNLFSCSGPENGLQPGHFDMIQLYLTDVSIGTLLNSPKAVFDKLVLVL